MARGTVRMSEVYPARGSTQEPPVASQASGPMEQDARPAMFVLGLVGLLIALRVLFEMAE